MGAQHGKDKDQRTTKQTRPATATVTPPPSTSHTDWSLLERKWIVANAVLVGDSGVGKSSALKKLRNHPFYYRYTQSLGDGDTLILEIPILNSTVELTITSPPRSLTDVNRCLRYQDIVIFCYDITSIKSLQELNWSIRDKYLIAMEERYTNESRVTAFLGLKSDLQDRRQVSLDPPKEINESKLFGSLFFEASSVDPEDNAFYELLEAATIQYLENRGYLFENTLVNILCQTIARNANQWYGGIAALKPLLPTEVYQKIEKLSGSRTTG
eukprot:TRINITY_DN8205_c0_g1_i1.p1 TRINITY_DN8205_c0_g1~~TRINITY_DN8205_c0_g1_i1.p1  ORF type:complete len:270 (-),score=44.24 TRINITY_DN8205_c0_g1_i1:116-925(-)